MGLRRFVIPEGVWALITERLLNVGLPGGLGLDCAGPTPIGLARDEATAARVEDEGVDGGAPPDWSQH